MLRMSMTRRESSARRHAADVRCPSCRAVNGGGGGEASVERCRELVRTLQVMLSWMRAARQRMRHQQSLGGDLVSLQQQFDELAVCQQQHCGSISMN